MIQRVSVYGRFDPDSVRLREWDSERLFTEGFYPSVHLREVWSLGNPFSRWCLLPGGSTAHTSERGFRSSVWIQGSIKTAVLNDPGNCPFFTYLGYKLQHLAFSKFLFSSRSPSVFISRLISSNYFLSVKVTRIEQQKIQRSQVKSKKSTDKQLQFQNRSLLGPVRESKYPNLSINGHLGDREKWPL